VPPAVVTAVAVVAVAVAVVEDDGILAVLIPV
jgi:hypothetical protein